MTVYFPDVSPFQGGIAMTGAPAVCLKTTEGTGWASGKWFTDALARARSAGAFPMAYHFLHAGNGSGQAGWAHAHAGGVPLMLDLEPTGSSRPTVADGLAFIDAYRHGGGTCNMVYFPHWYHGQLGSPSLAGFAQRKVALWSSAYTSYSDANSGAGWQPYGGMTPAIWQYTDKHAFNGQTVDFSAYRGTLDQLKALAGGAGGAAPAAGDPTIQMGAKGAAVSKAQARLNVHGSAHPALKVDGDFGKATHDGARQFQKDHKLGIDGVIGPATWGQLNKAPASAPAPHPSSGTPGKPYHGAWVSAGQQSLDALCNGTLGYPVNAVVRMTAVHFGAFDPLLAGYIAGLANGTVKPADHLPKGATVWCN